MPQARVIDGILVFGETDERTLEQARRCAEEADRTALMADNHLGYAQPVGGVTPAYRTAVRLFRKERVASSNLVRGSNLAR